MKGATRRPLRTLFAAALILALAPAAFAKNKVDVPEIPGATPAARVDAARKLATENPEGLAHALAAIADAKPKKDAAAEALDFLVPYLVGEPSRVLRLLAVDAAERIDPAGAAERLRPFAVPEDAFTAACAAEALGYVGTKEDVPPLVELARITRLDVSVAAIRALARIGDKKSVTQLVDIALTHERAEIGDECAWAVQDILKKEKAILAKLKKAAGKDVDKRIRYDTIAAMLADESQPLHAWDKKSLDKLRKLALDRPDEVGNPNPVRQRKAKVTAVLAWLKESLPAHHFSVVVAVKSIDFPIKKDPTKFLDRDELAVGIPIGLKGVSYIKQSEGQVAYHVLRSAMVLLEHAMGNPTWGRRGWHNAVSDTYDLCKIAGLYSVADGVNRDGLLDQIYGLQSPPWRGE